MADDDGTPVTTPNARSRVLCRAFCMVFTFMFYMSFKLALMTILIVGVVDQKHELQDYGSSYSYLKKRGRLDFSPRIIAVEYVIMVWSMGTLISFFGIMFMLCCCHFRPLQNKKRTVRSMLIVSFGTVCIGHVLFGGLLQTFAYADVPSGRPQTFAVDCAKQIGPIFSYVGAVLDAIVTSYLLKSHYQDRKRTNRNESTGNATGNVDQSSSTADPSCAEIEPQRPMEVTSDAPPLYQSRRNSGEQQRHTQLQDTGSQNLPPYTAEPAAFSFGRNLLGNDRSSSVIR